MVANFHLYVFWPWVIKLKPRIIFKNPSIYASNAFLESLWGARYDFLSIDQSTTYYLPNSNRRSVKKSRLEAFVEARIENPRCRELRHRRVISRGSSLNRMGSDCLPGKIIILFKQYWQSSKLIRLWESRIPTSRMKREGYNPIYVRVSTEVDSSQIRN